MALGGGGPGDRWPYVHIPKHRSCGRPTQLQALGSLLPPLPRDVTNPAHWLSLCTGSGDVQGPGFRGATDLTPGASRGGPQVTPPFNGSKAELNTCPLRAQHLSRVPSAGLSGLSGPGFLPRPRPQLPSRLPSWDALCEVHVRAWLLGAWSPRRASPPSGLGPFALRHDTCQSPWLLTQLVLRPTCGKRPPARGLPAAHLGAPWGRAAGRRPACPQASPGGRSPGRCQSPGST